jgi:AmmeMemoRadiSam system protein A
MEAVRPPVGEEDQHRLLAWARQAIAASVGRGSRPRIDESDLSEALAAPRSAFVTLTKRGELRGCIGRLDPDRPLWENVLASAVSAAVEDPRFEPVRASELHELRLEISILDVPVEIEDPDAFDPAVHGIIVERGARRGLLLPKVAHEYGWGRSETLAAACWKAGLPPEAWRDQGTRLSVFTAFVFAESASRDTSGISSGDTIGASGSDTTPQADPGA